MSDAPWQALDHELASWRRAGRVPSMWWRDDDATAPSPSLERLLALSGRHRVPLSLAVIPASMDGALAPLLGGDVRVTVLQHGYAHADHAAADEPSAELGEHRAAAVVLDELARGAGSLTARFAARFLPVLVPPWNRIADSLVPALARLGYRGLSCFAPRSRAATAQGVVCSNCHLDPVDWRAGGCFRGEPRSLGSLVDHLCARRTGSVDRDEPTGLLTHHWRHDEPTWDFLDRLLSRLARPGDARWLDATGVFAP